MMPYDPFSDDIEEESVGDVVHSTSSGSWRIWAQTLIEWFRALVREQKRQKNDIHDLYKKYEDLNTRVTNTREEFLRSDHDIDIDVTKIKSELSKDASDIGGKYGALIGGIISIIVIVLSKFFGL